MNSGLADNLKNLLDMEDMPFQEFEKPVETKTPVEPTAVAIIEVPVAANKDEELEKDLEVAKRVTYDVFNKANRALEHLLTLSVSLESPRGFEVANMMMKTLSDTAAQLLSLHEKTETILEKRAKRTKPQEDSPSVVNNTIFISPTDLLKQRNASKAIDIVPVKKT